MIVRGVAPSALRSPISRIRSVTETSMMFMTPIPPTSNEMAAMLAEQDREDARRRRRGVDDGLLAAHGEVRAGGGDPVAC